LIIFREIGTSLIAVLSAHDKAFHFDAFVLE